MVDPEKLASEVIECFTQYSKRLLWNKSISRCKLIENVHSTCNIIHTVYQKTFFIEDKEFIEKEYIIPGGAISEKMNDQLCIYTSSVPISYFKREMKQSDKHRSVGFRNAVQTWLDFDNETSPSGSTLGVCNSAVKLETSMQGFTVQKITLLKFCQDKHTAKNEKSNVCSMPYLSVKIYDQSFNSQLKGLPTNEDDMFRLSHSSKKTKIEEVRSKTISPEVSKMYRNISAFVKLLITEMEERDDIE
uniref:START domain-containing protein n=1 Tax=Euplotes harpa TaxID=151035 RepID=A0A7S3J2Q9_9SPIT